MNKKKAIIKAEQMKDKIQQPCYVIRVKLPFKWYSLMTWFPNYENVSDDYISFHTTNCKIYYKTK